MNAREYVKSKKKAEQTKATSPRVSASRHSERNAESQPVSGFASPRLSEKPKRDNSQIGARSYVKIRKQNPDVSGRDVARYVNSAPNGLQNYTKTEEGSTFKVYRQTDPNADSQKNANQAFNALRTPISYSDIAKNYVKDKTTGSHDLTDALGQREHIRKIGYDTEAAQKELDSLMTPTEEVIALEKKVSSGDATDEDRTRLTELYDLFEEDPSYAERAEKEVDSRRSTLRREIKEIGDYQTMVGYYGLMANDDFEINSGRTTDWNKYDKAVYGEDYNDPLERLNADQLREYGRIRQESGAEAADNYMAQVLDYDGGEWYPNGIYLSDEEKKIFNYILNTQGDSAAEKYLRNMESTANYRAALADYASKNHTGISGLLNDYGAYISGGIERGIMGFGNIFTNEAMPNSKSEQYSAIVRKNRVNNAGSGIGKWVEGAAADVLTSTGQMIPAMMIGLFNPTAGTIAFSASAGGNYKQEALRLGYTAEQATQYGILAGASEGVLEKLLGGVVKVGGGALGNLASSGMTKISNVLARCSVNNELMLRFGAKYLGNIAGEFADEYLQEILDPVFRNICLDENNKFKPFTEEALYSGIIGALNAGILNIAAIPETYDSAKEGTAANKYRYIIGDLQTDGAASKANPSASNTDVSEIAAILTDAGVDSETAEKMAPGLQTAISEFAARESEVKPDASVETAMQTAKDATAPKQSANDALIAAAKEMFAEESAKADFANKLATMDKWYENAETNQSVPSESDLPVVKKQDNTESVAPAGRTSFSDSAEISGSFGNSGIRQADAALPAQSDAERIRANNIAAVKESAASLGTNGAKVLTDMYSEDMNASEYVIGMTSYYNSGKKGESMDSVKASDALTEPMREAAYLAGQMDAAPAGRESFNVQREISNQSEKLLRPQADAAPIVKSESESDSIPLAKQPDSGYNETITDNITEENDIQKTEVITNGERARNAGSREGGERNYGLDSGEPGRGVQRRAEEAAKRRETQMRRGESVRAAVDAQGVVSRSTASLGISSGTDKKCIRIVPGDAWNDEMRAVAKNKNKSGVRVTYFVGDLEMYEKNKETYTARGAVSNNKKHMWIRADDPSFTVTQIADHEEFHFLVKKDPGLLERTRKLLIQKYGDAELTNLVNLYIDAYGATDTEIGEIFEEVLADAYAGIDIFEEVSDFGGATIYTDTVRESAKTVRGGETEKVDTRFSRNLDSKNGFTEDDLQSIRAIDQKSINSFTSEEIKATEKWARKFYKELGVKSPFFRARFGDWRAYEQNKAQYLDKIKISGVSSASDGSKWISNGIKNRILYRGNAINNDTKYEINIGNKVYNDTLTYANRALSRDKDISNYVARLTLLGSIKEIVENSVLLDTITMKEDEKNVDRTFVHKFYTAAKIDSKYYLVKLTVDEFNSLNGTIRRAYNVNNIEISPIAVSQVYSPASTIGDIGDFLSDSTVADLYQLVKQYDKEFSPKPVNPILLNEDGTPKTFYHQTYEVFTEFDLSRKTNSASDSGTPNGVFLKSSDNDIGIRGDRQMPLYAFVSKTLIFENREEAAKWYSENVHGYQKTLQKIDEIDRFYGDRYDRQEKKCDDFYFSHYDDVTTGRMSEEEFQRGSEDGLDEILEEWESESEKARTNAREILDRYFAKSDYDSIYLKYDAGSNGRKTDALIVFDKGNVKSATDNIGTFDGDNSDIRFSKNLRRKVQRGRSVEIETMENNRFERLRKFGDNLPTQWFAYTYGYFYIYENHSYTDYTILAKVSITDSNRAAIRKFTEGLRNGTFGSTETFSAWLDSFQRGRGRYNWDSVSTGDAGTASRNDGLDEQTRKRDGFGDSEKDGGTGNENGVKDNFSREVPIERLKKAIANMTPMQIASLSEEDASTTPSFKPYAKSEIDKESGKESKFYGSAEKSSNVMDETRRLIRNMDDIKYYSGVANLDLLNAANERLNLGGSKEALRWTSIDADEATAEDVALGFILLKRYQDAGMYEEAANVVRHLREMGTKAGQKTQAFSLLGRMTPEGMEVYAQKELDHVRNEMIRQYGEAWVEQRKAMFELTADECERIKSLMTEASNLPNGRDKTICIAKIAAILNDKIPSSIWMKLKSSARVNMLLNSKTMIRNILGNACMMPVYAVQDFIAAGIDKAFSLKTGIRTTGALPAKTAFSAAKRGLFESFEDFRLHINTRDVSGDRFEVGSAQAFHHYVLAEIKAAVGKNPIQTSAMKAGMVLSDALNMLDRVTNFLLDAGDRPFFEYHFIKSINNQVALNHVSEPTPEMIEIATAEALARTWQDDNAYTKAVSKIRSAINLLGSQALKIGSKDAGIGDLLMPFIKTPANLAKALIEYSPAGLVNSTSALIIKSKMQKQKGKIDAKTQKAAVDALSKMITGTLLMLLFGALAQKGLLTGGNDDKDKDLASFEQNIMGVAPYSVVVNGKSYTYDWAQPIGGLAAISADIAQNSVGGQTIANVVLNGISTGGNVLFEQSFLKGISELFGEAGLVPGLMNALSGSATQLVPSALSQIAQLADPVSRTSYEYKDLPQTTINKIRARVPGLRNALVPVVDVLGHDVLSYGGDNNLFNVFINPANIYSKTENAVAEEIYRVYGETGDATIIPRVAPYYIEKGDVRYNFTAEERAAYQRTAGQTNEKIVADLLKHKGYSALDDKEKAKVLNLAVDFANAKAKYTYLQTQDVEYERMAWMVNAENGEPAGVSVADYLLAKAATADIKKGIDGKAYSESYLIMEALYDIPGMNLMSNDSKREYLFEAFGVSEKVRHFSKALVSEKLEKIRAEADISD